MKRRKIILVVAVASQLCCRGEKDREPHGQPAAQQPAPQPPKPAPAPSATPPPSPVVRDRGGLLVGDGASDIFVGNLYRNSSADMRRPSEYCLEDGSFWQGSSFRLGRVNLFGLPLDVGPVEFSKQLAVYGSKESPLFDVIRRVGDCPDGYGGDNNASQLRQDWLADEGGFRTTRARLAELPYLKAVAYEILRLHLVLIGDDEVARVELTNPFNVDLVDLPMRYHYESGKGKPSPRYVDRALTLLAGESVVLEVPRRHQGRWQLVGIQLRGQAGRVELDVELKVK